MITDIYCDKTMGFIDIHLTILLLSFFVGKLSFAKANCYHLCEMVRPKIHALKNFGARAKMQRRKTEKIRKQTNERSDGSLFPSPFFPCSLANSICINISQDSALLWCSK